jgi:hypothetical protein
VAAYPMPRVLYLLTCSCIYSPVHYNPRLFRRFVVMRCPLKGCGAGGTVQYRRQRGSYGSINSSTASPEAVFVPIPLLHFTYSSHFAPLGDHEVFSSHCPLVVESSRRGYSLSGSASWILSSLGHHIPPRHSHPNSLNLNQPLL